VKGRWFYKLRFFFKKRHGIKTKSVRHRPSWRGNVNPWKKFILTCCLHHFQQDSSLSLLPFSRNSRFIDTRPKTPKYWKQKRHKWNQFIVYPNPPSGGFLYWWIKV